MQKSRIPTYVAAAAVVAVVLAITGVRFASLLPYSILLVCPLMMIFMMKGMGSMGGKAGSDKEDHTGHGCEHDPTAKVDAPSRPS